MVYILWVYLKLIVGFEKGAYYYLLNYECKQDGTQEINGQLNYTASCTKFLHYM